MAKIKLKLNENHILLIKNFKFKTDGDLKNTLDGYSPYGGDHLIENLAMIFGKWDKFIPGTETYYGGRRYEEDVETEMLSYHNHVVENINYILSLMVEFIEIGLKPGTYSCIDYKLDWKYSEK